ncbi:hypothetical protein DVH24_027670 [Malus domestica]|uniref:Uncharacterized protein n=1 Tax=Malus domestica TaxID=3750 RepID=A0A498HEQ3_MALDO|nr:hypothetical protein DVH24_027670 [Malus domestica]
MGLFLAYGPSTPQLDTKVDPTKTIVQARRRNNCDGVDTEGHSFCSVVGIDDGGVVSLRLSPGYNVRGAGPKGGPQSLRQN